MNPEKVLSLARGELGVKATGQNNVKYNTAYYNRIINAAGYAWCAVFVWWVLREAGCPELFYGGQKTAYCPTLLSYYKGKGQAVTGNYQPGDIIFFNFSGKSNAAHVGICESWDGTYITTIDGNTSTASDANGGGVMRRKRHKQYIVGAARPAYQKEDAMDEARIRAIVREELAKAETQRANAPASDWAGPHIRQAIDRGLMKATATGSIDRPQALATRQELATVANAMFETLKG